MNVAQQERNTARVRRNTRNNMMRIAALLDERGIDYLFHTTQEGDAQIEIYHEHQADQLLTKDSLISDLWWLTD